MDRPTCDTACSKSPSKAHGHVDTAEPNLGPWTGADEQNTADDGLLSSVQPAPSVPVAAGANSESNTDPTAMPDASNQLTPTDMADTALSESTTSTAHGLTGVPLEMAGLSASEVNDSQDHRQHSASGVGHAATVGTQNHAEAIGAQADAADYAPSHGMRLDAELSFGLQHVSQRPGVSALGSGRIESPPDPPAVPNHHAMTSATQAQHNSQHEDQGPCIAPLVKPVLLTRNTSPHRHQRRHGPLGEPIFSPSDSPDYTPPSSPPAQAKASCRHGGAQQRQLGWASTGGRQPLRALPLAAYRPRRTPVDQLLTNYAMTKHVGQLIQERQEQQAAEAKARQLQALPDPLKDLTLAAERLQQGLEGLARAPRRRSASGRASAPYSLVDRSVHVTVGADNDARGSGGGRGGVGGDDGGDDAVSMGEGELWVDGNLFGSPPGWASDLSSSRPGSAQWRSGQRLRQQDSGDGRHPGMTGLSAYQGLGTQMQGAYLTCPKDSFGGYRPLKASPEPGVPFERYGHRDEPASAVQQMYLRPDRSVLIAMQQVAERQQQQQQQQQQQILLLGAGTLQEGAEAVPRPQSPPKMLPNGVPLSRLEQLREVQEQTRSRMVKASHKHNGSLQMGKSGQPEPALTPSQSLRAEGSTLLTVQDSQLSSTPHYDQQRAFFRALSTKASMPRKLSTLPAELEAAASSAVEMGLTAFETAPDTAEPVLDPHFFAAMKAHFNQLAENHTLQLQSKLNTGLPTILKQFGVKHVNAPLSMGTGRRSGRLPID